MFIVEWLNMKKTYKGLSQEKIVFQNISGRIDFLVLTHILNWPGVAGAVP